MGAVEAESIVTRSSRRPSAGRRRPPRQRLAGLAGPYLLILPAVAVIALVLAYPLYKLVEFSLDKYGLFQLIRHKPQYIGLKNYETILKQHEFYTVLWRTVVFTAVNVAATIAFGTLVALLLLKVSKPVRIALSAALVFVWAMPAVVSITVWNWLFDQEFGVVNYALTKAHAGHFLHHDWYASSLQGFFVVTVIVVWGAIPFVAITMNAALTQVPDELLEAARVDGASPMQSFRRITLPIVRPVVVILTSLSIIWDFQVFSQIWILRDYRPEPQYYLMSIYSFHESFGVHEYGLGSAIAVITVVLLMCVSWFYIRQMVKIGEAQ